MVLFVSSFPLTFSVVQLHSTSTSTFDLCGDYEEWVNRADEMIKPEPVGGTEDT